MTEGANSGIYRKFILGGGGLLAMSIVTLFLFRVAFLEFAGKIILNSLGFDGVILSVNEVTTDSLQIRTFSLSDQITLNNITLDFRPSFLARGEIDRIDIGSFFIDLSNPEKGAISRILALVENRNSESEPSGERRYPEVFLREGTVTMENNGRAVHATMEGRLSPDLILTGKSSVQGRIETATGPVLFKDVQLSLSADIDAQSATAELNGGAIRDGRVTPDWTPLAISGSVQLVAGRGTLKMAVTTAQGQSLGQIEGSYDVEEKIGDVGLFLKELVFRKDGLQPANLTRYAENLPPLEGVLNITAKAKITGQIINYGADLALGKMTLDLADGRIASDYVPLSLTGQYSWEDNSQQAKVSLPGSAIDFAYMGRQYLLNDLIVEMNILNFSEKLDLVNLSGWIGDKSQNPDFSPFLFSASGEVDKLRTATLKGELQSIKAGFNLDFSAQYDLENGEGSLSADLPKTFVGERGVSIAALSPHLKAFDGGFSGTVTAGAEITRNVEGALIFSSLHAELQGGKWQKNDMAFTGLSLDISGGQADAKEVLKGRIRGRAENLSFNEQKMSIPTLKANFDSQLDNLQLSDKAHLSISELTAKPGEGALFKELQKVTGEATLNGDDVDFTFNSATDYLGTYLKIEGRHSFSNSAGRVNVAINPFSFVKDGLQPVDLIVMNSDVTIEGEVAPIANLTWTKNGINGTADVKMQDVSIKAPGGSIGSMTGNIHIDELFPLTISTPQEIKAQTAVAGISLEEPSIRFRVATKQGSPVLYIDRLTVGMVGGSAFVDSAVIDTAAKTNRVEVQLTQLDLEEVFALSNVEELIATGRVSGRVPLIFGGDRLIVDNGLLAADGPGILKMTSAAARQALGGGGEQAKLLLDILENFRYSELSIEIIKTESGEDTVKLHAAGSNPDVENNRPVVLNINLATSLDKIFNAILQGYLLSEKALRATVNGR